MQICQTSGRFHGVELTGEECRQHGRPVQPFHDEIGPSRLVHRRHRETKTRYVGHDCSLRRHVSAFAVAAKDASIIDDEDVSVSARRQGGRIHHTATVTDAAVP